MAFVIKIKLMKFFEILKKNNFVIKSDLSDYLVLIEVILNKKLNSNTSLKAQIKSKLLYLQRQWKKLVIKSSGPKYLKFYQLLETELVIRVSQVDFLNEIGQNIKNITDKLNDIHIENKIDLKDFIDLNKRLKKFHL